MMIVGWCWQQHDVCMVMISMMCLTEWWCEQQGWWAKMMSSIDEQKRWAEINEAAVSSGTAELRVMTKTDWRNRLSFNCKSKLVLLLRLGYLKPFLAGYKKTRQGPGSRVGALCISRCWFCLTIVAGPKIIQKDYKIILCCVLVCYGSLWMKCLCYVNDVYEMIMVE